MKYLLWMELNTPQDHKNTLIMMDELIENYDDNLLLNDLLWKKIERYEDTAPELSEFNQRIGDMDAGASMLHLLIAQHQLKTDDFHDEMRAKSVVSMITNEKKSSQPITLKDYPFDSISARHYFWL